MEYTRIGDYVDGMEYAEGGSGKKKTKKTVNGDGASPKDKKNDKNFDVCGFMSSPYDDKNAEAAYEKVDLVYEWYEDFFNTFNESEIALLSREAETLQISYPIQFVIKDLRLVHADLRKKMVELHKERNRLYLLALQMHTSQFVDAESRGRIKMTPESEPDVMYAFKHKRLEYANNIRLDRFMALFNRDFRDDVADFIRRKHIAVSDSAIKLDPIFRRLDYDPVNDVFFVTYGSSLDDVTIRFRVDAAKFPEPIYNHTDIMVFGDFRSTAFSTIRIVDGAYEDVVDILNKGRTMTRTLPRRKKFGFDYQNASNKS